MQLEKQVCSLDLARRLKELGVEQDSAFFHSSVMPKGEIIPAHAIQPDLAAERYSAFTVAELGELLPQGYPTWWYAKQDGQVTTIWRVAKSVYDDEKISAEDATEANARAKMLIHLLEHHLEAR